MPAKITQPITKRNYELIRDRILEILVTELDYQAQITYDADIEECGVYLERGGSMDLVEFPAVVISTGMGEYGNKNQGSIDGTYKYFIDVYANAQTTGSQPGDYISAVKMQKILGVCMAILEDQAYKTLGFAPPFIMKSQITDFNIAEPKKEDSLNTAMGRASFSVSVNEKTNLKQGTLIDGYETTVRIDNTGKGYIYIGENYQ